MNPSVSVVVPARNEEDYIGPCLASILAQEPRPDEVIVVDNGSTDRTAEIARGFGVRVVYQPQPGLHIARQTGLEAASSEVVAATDADCRVEPGWVAAIQEAFRDPQVVETYGPLEFYDGPLFDRLLSRYGYPLFLALMDRLGQPNAAGGNHAVRRRVALEVGGYDVPFGEDLRLMQKLRQKGRIVYTPKARVLTSGRRLKRGRWKMYGVHLKNIWARLRGLPQDYGPDYYADRERR
ncbi:putative glycosyltransferase EpsJ [Meiothermus luteus]|jgi:glycosyltransferase involved in cell wall biosynthesis|uniref:Putative glycosyltransferase EpsJ n=1 Tax=Meiothermus luteus TaxID=2026184 RepID=A0A399ET65_9DEIN|nr:glycosyltransferase [Meiothermus luteus]RIH85792.1 putative glycosyltransferase EpsJ [Meiothermus luteus]RMH55820.1 MAG: glycosyltransferase [Deinococcota bacterium]